MDESLFCSSQDAPVRIRQVTAAIMLIDRDTTLVNA